MNKLNLILEVLLEIAEAPDITDGRALQEMLRSKLSRLPETDKPTGTTVTDRTPESRRALAKDVFFEEGVDGVDLYGAPFGFCDEEGCGDSYGVSVVGDGTWIQVTENGSFTVSHIGPGAICYENPYCDCVCAWPGISR